MLEACWGPKKILLTEVRRAQERVTKVSTYTPTKITIHLRGTAFLETLDRCIGMPTSLPWQQETDRFFRPRSSIFWMALYHQRHRLKKTVLSKNVRVVKILRFLSWNCPTP
ncbi:uncharacterized protein [Apostichopus japonicus]|uniref:uncharacterized protein n=1 Tax=Stichopus japonicus TaxID=307972 RepID=UPI003AB22638